MSVDTAVDPTYTAAVGLDEIRVPDEVSWKRSYDDRRMFGVVMDVRRGRYLVRSELGVMFTLRRCEITKECR